MALLEVNGIGKSFGATKVLRDISFDLAEGEALAIIGSSGSGKTTLLRCLNFLETADTGSITVAGETLWSAADTKTQSEEAIRKKRLHFGLARGDFREKSDIDLAVEGGDFIRFSIDVNEDTSTLLKFDIVDLDEKIQEELMESIQREGRVLYEKI